MLDGKSNYHLSPNQENQKDKWKNKSERQFLVQTCIPPLSNFAWFADLGAMWGM